MIAIDVVPERVEGAEPVSESDIPVIEFVRPLPGFPELRRFALVQLDDDGVLCSLRSVEDDAVRFLVVPPHVFFPEYEAEISDEAAAEMGITAAEDVQVLVVLNAGASLADTTANLLAPVLVHTGTRQALQVILDDASLPIRAPLLS